MGSPSFLVFFLFLFFNVLSLSAAQESRDHSAVSFTLCEGFTGAVNFRIDVRDKQSNTLSTTFTGETRQKTLDGKIHQRNVKDIKVVSDREICFQALVVDTTIIVDQPTNFKASCEANADQDIESLPPCKELRSRVRPVFICPQALTNLLREEGVIANEPTETPGGQDFEPPIYDITNDMIQASSTIADGLTEGFGTIVKHRLQTLADARKIKVDQISKSLNSFASFLSALGPAFNVFGGITSIVTTFLTPNPFDEMAKYLKTEFDAIHARLSHLQDDIGDLKDVVEAQSSVVAMADKLASIRYSLRRYERMMDSLSKNPVCGSNNLLRRGKVREFMKQYKDDRVEDSLLDLLTVEFGEVVEASSLLKPFMRAYCGPNPAKVQRFMQEISNYAYVGALAHFAYKDLECRKKGRRNCDSNGGQEREEWLMKLYKFMRKADAIKEAAVNPALGLHLDIKEDLDKVIYDEVKKAPNAEATEFLGLFEKVKDFIINKLYDVNDWPEACIVNLNSDRTVIIEVAQMSARNYGCDFKPWYLMHSQPTVELEEANLNIKNAQRGSTKKELSWHQILDVFCDPIPPKNQLKECKVRAWADVIPPSEESKDRIIYFLFNPISYLLTVYPLPFVTVSPKVVINMFPIDVYYASRSDMERRGVQTVNSDVAVGCWLFNREGNFYACRAPSQRDPDRETWDEERYFAIIAE